MRNSNQDLLKNNAFFRCSIFALLLALPIIVFIPKQVSFLLINQIHNPFFDVFFTIVTYLGDGIFILALIIILFLLKQKKLAVLMLITYLASGLVAQLIKNNLDTFRPAGFITNTKQIHFLPWFPISIYNTFPSGHTATAFAAAFTFTLFTHNKKLHIFLFVLAFLVAYSRIYLAKHFIMDVWFGAVIGLYISWFTHYIYLKYFYNTKQ